VRCVRGVVQAAADPAALLYGREVRVNRGVERFIRSMRNECCRRIVVPMHVANLRAEVLLYLVWYNHHRSHQALGGCTPDEVHFPSRAREREAKIRAQGGMATGQCVRRAVGEGERPAWCPGSISG